MTLIPVTLRPGRLADLEAIIALDRASDSAPHWPPAAYAAILAPDGTQSLQRFLVVAQSSSADTAPIAGFVVAALHGSPPDIAAELEDVIVAEHLRRSGIGRALCHAAINWVRTHGATSISLEVRAASTGAIALYSALGFSESGRRPRYYSNPVEDAVLMQLAISPPALSSSRT